jgi:hypothetical protein
MYVHVYVCASFYVCATCQSNTLLARVYVI